MTDAPETKMQRIQRLQAERIVQLESKKPAPAPLPAVTMSCDIPPPALVRQLFQGRLNAPSGQDQKIAAALLATLLLPFADYLKSQLPLYDGFKALALEFWISCLRAGTFPHLPERTKTSDSEFMNWVVVTSPYVTGTGEIPNWKTR